MQTGRFIIKLRSIEIFAKDFSLIKYLQKYLSEGYPRTKRIAFCLKQYYVKYFLQRFQWIGLSYF